VRRRRHPACNIAMSRVGGITLHASTRISTLISIRGSANFSGVVQLLQTEVLCQTEGPNF
jgi:hypothetical protein